MVIKTRRPVTEEFLEFETEVMKRATEVYGYVWPKDSEVNYNKKNPKNLER